MSLPTPSSIAVVGDRGSGKSSLVWRIVVLNGGDVIYGDQDQLPSSLAPSLGEFVMEMMDGDGHTDIILNDTTSHTDADEQAQESLIRECSTVVLCVPSNSPTSTSSIGQWIRRILQIREPLSSPVLVCGTMLDLPNPSRTAEEFKDELDDAIASVAPHPKLWMQSIVTSALSGEGMADALQKAHDMSADPLFPLLDPITQEMTSKAKAALSHVFQLCDIDGRHRLSDTEIAKYQRTVFGLELTQDDITALKELCAECEGGVSDGGITLAGFLHLHLLQLRAGDTKSVWQTLRQYGYDRSLIFNPCAEWGTESLVSPESRDRNAYLTVDRDAASDPSRWSVSSNAGSASRMGSSASSFFRVDRDELQSPSLDQSFALVDPNGSSSSSSRFPPPSPFLPPGAVDSIGDTLSVKDSVTTAMTRPESVCSQSDGAGPHPQSQQTRLAILTAGVVAASVGVAAYWVLGQRQHSHKRSSFR